MPARGDSCAPADVTTDVWKLGGANREGVRGAGREDVLTRGLPGESVIEKSGALNRGLRGFGELEPSRER